VSDLLYQHLKVSYERPLTDLAERVVNGCGNCHVNLCM